MTEFKSSLRETCYSPRNKYHFNMKLSVGINIIERNIDFKNSRAESLT